MHLALTPRRRLAALYGPEAPAVLAALDLALAARAGAGIASHAYDPEEGLPDLDIAPAALVAEDLVAQIGAMAKALAARGTIIESLWIVGGPRAVPFGSLPNPVPDRDGPIQTDLIYALADQAGPLAQWAVGRTPDAEPHEPGLLTTFLRHIAVAHGAGPWPQAPVLALSAARWSAVSDQVLAGAGVTDALHLLSPPATAGGGALDGARIIYCNLHGVRHADPWFGQAPDDSELVEALGPADLGGAGLAGAVVISQACFGARLGSPAGERSLAAALLAAGASAVVAAHGLTYGAPDPPPSESDLLAQGLIAALLRPGARAGAALLEAQTGLLRARVLERGQPDADDIKTLLGFGLYGDPALRVS
ncbi:MAG: hypothetical protein HGA45_35300 [Chloroflexales bacterium]|nr:hypothetical protein [Chloroflexales bacterium]